MKKTVFIVSLLLLTLFSLSAESFYIERYDIDVNVLANRVYEVTEEIDMYFTSPSHGFYRDIPVRYDTGYEAILSDIQVSEEFEKETNGDYLSLKIGSADRLIEGRRHYSIRYSYDLGADVYPDYDEFYFNLIGDGWNCDIDEVNFSVTFPKPVSEKLIWLTAGRYGSTGRKPFTLKGNTVSGHVTGLMEKEALTLRVEMEEGYFVGARVPKDWSGVGLFTILPLTVLVLLFLYSLYRKYGVDKPIVIYPRFEAPSLSPMAVGYIYDSSADDRDFSAMIFYWADRGCLTIEEKGKDFILHRKKDPESPCEEENLLFASLFANGDDLSVGSMASMKIGVTLNEKIKPALIKRYTKGPQALADRTAEGKSGLAMIVTMLYALAASILNNLGDLEIALISVIITIVFAAMSGLMIWTLLRKHTTRIGARIVIGSVLAVLAFALSVVLFMFSSTVRCTPVFVMISSGILAFSIPLMSALSLFISRRSDYGQATVEEILGYREFLEKVEADKLRTLIDQDPEYFYHNLSYAIALGLEDKWAKKFQGLFFSPASWYIGSDPVMNYLFYAGMFRRFNSGYTAKMIASGFDGHASGGASTFSGSSGFSGGGFGGGGGRSW